MSQETPVVYASRVNKGPKATTKPASNWQQTIQQDIAQREYYIHYDAEKGVHQSPNRASNTRISYLPQKISIVPRALVAYEPIELTGLTSERKIAQTFEDYLLDIDVLGYGTTKQLIHTFQAKNLVNKQMTACAADENMQVEYINNEKGTRQNFIITQPVSGTELSVHLNISTSLTVTRQNESGIQFSGKQKNTKLFYNDLKVWDATGKALPAKMILRAINTPHFCSLRTPHSYELLLAVNTENATYPITVDPLVSSGTLTNADWRKENNVSNAYMGNSVSSAGDVNGDGYSDVIVAAYGHTNTQTSEGAVFIYHGSATGLSTSAARSIYGGSASLWLGSSVSAAGDVNGDGYSDVIIGCTNYTNGQSNEGAVYVYHGSASGIGSSPTVILESNIASGQMGSEVSGAGDVNGDGYSDIVVGAQSYANGQSAEGAFWVFHGSASGINTTAAQFVESDQASWWMGKGVGGAGDVNGDGYSDVLVGLYGYTNGQTDEGATYVYHGSASGIGSTPNTILEGNVASIRMGESVCGAGDVNGDGYSDVVVGLLGYTNGQNQEGAAYIYHGSASGVNTTLAAKVEPNVASAIMGSAVGCAGDVNGDGYSDIVVGAYNYTNGQNNEGAIWVYKGSSTGINTTAYAFIQSNTASANLGISNTSAGDVNGDGYSDVIAGAYFLTNGQSNEGAACVYHGGASGIVTTSSAVLESNQAIASLGWSASGAGDVNGDGYSDVIAGASYYDNGETDEGAAFVYHGSASGISTTASAMVESNQAGANSGQSVGAAGDVNGDGYDDIVVGAHYYDNGQTSEGAVFVYHGSSGGVSTTVSVILESNQADAYLGISVSGAGDVNGDGYSDVIAGAYYYDNGQTNEGVAFVYHGSASGISSTVAALLECNQASAYLGRSVSGAGDVNGDGYSDVFVGANNFDNGETDEGAAFVYHGSISGLGTAASATLECNQASAQLGISVSGAGDVNGDGYSDVIAGAYGYDNGQNNEGVAFVYHGSASGIATTAAAVLESNQADAYLGWYVSGAGDINGDGYGDVVAGASYYDNGQTDEGAIFVYPGSSGGIATTASAVLECNQASANMGYSAGGAGDVNGDGYSDVVAGIRNYTNGQSIEGAAFVYYGNGGATGRRNNLRLYNTDLSTPIQQSNKPGTTFGAGLYATSFQGRQKVKLVWEVKQQGQAFSSAGGVITNSVSSTSSQGSYTSTGTAGTELKSTITKPGFQTKIRVRVQYDLVTSSTGQKYGPWRYPQGYLNEQNGMNSTPLPVEWLNFTAQWLMQGESAQLNWSTASEKNNDYFTLLRSFDGVSWEEVNRVPGAGTTNIISNYTYIDRELKHTNTPALTHVYYRLMQTDHNGQFSFSEIRELDLQAGAGIQLSLSPNPAHNITMINWKATSADDMPYTLKDVQGNERRCGVIAAGENSLTLDLQTLPAGVYIFSLIQNGREQSMKLVRQ